VTRDRRDYLSSQVSVTGTITVEGILFSGHAFDAKHAKYNPLLLQNEDGTLSIAFYFAKEAGGSAGLEGTNDLETDDSKTNDFPTNDFESDDFETYDDEWGVFESEFKTGDFILNCQHVLLLGPDYSDALVLEPIDGKDEFTLLRVGKISAIIRTGNHIPLPKLLCMRPISGEELEFARNGVLSQPDKFPLLRDSSLLWSKRDFSLLTDSDYLYPNRKFDPENPKARSLIEALQYLLSSSFLTYRGTEMELWARWQELERECMPTFRDPTNIESIAHHTLAQRFE
jgi:hypothetical protein